ncbi:MAG TPA: beta-N-acetylglucosaminidase domain-containing protein [Bacillales bacterium]|nr:beta-N-acetylglucosaminidase domain-containing protein [Bacillales bacterium]
MLRIKSSKSLAGKLIMICLALMLLVPASFTVNGGSANAKSPGKEKIVVSPTPQQLKVTGNGFPLTPVVGLVTGDQTDPSAIQEVVNVLKSHGVKQIVKRHADEQVPETPVTIWVGTPSDNAASVQALKTMDVTGPESLKPEGYILVSGHNDQGHKTIVLAGKDKAGTFYAAQTFRQIITEHSGRDWVPAVQIRDWPQMGIRGTIEGFYGPPWSHQDRMSQIAFYGRNKMNTYVYAPKDDPYHRDKWREPYPEKRVNQLQELVQKANQNHVQFVFAVSPGKSVCYSSDSDFQKLVNKMQTMYDIGVRSFALFFDDISQNLRCSQDKAMFGDDRSPAAAAQAYLLNRFNKQFIQTHEGTKRLITVPTDYYQSGSTTYRERFADLVDSDIVVYWTGIGVIAPTITSADADKIHKIFEHDLLIWDNYPVNDYITNRLLLGPLVGRDSDLSEHHVLGLTANPMIQAEASKIPLYTVADYAWNSDAYNPQKSWERSIKAFGGDASEALKTFAENSYSSRLNDTESPELTPLIEQFWPAYESGDAAQASQALQDEFQKIKQAPQQLREHLDNKNFLKETAPWLDKLEWYGKAGEAAVKMLMAQKANNGEAAWEQRLKLEKAFDEARAILQKMAPGVIKPFLEKAVAQNNQWLGLVANNRPMTTMGAYQNYTPGNMIDGDPSTLYWSNSSADSGDAVGVDLGAVYQIKHIKLLMGSTGGSVPRPDDYIHHGVLQYSRTGKIWRTLMSGDNQREINIDTDEIKARYIRYKATASQNNWVQVREFQVVSNKKKNAQVNGTPGAADGSSFAAAADGNMLTAYRADSAPKEGEALTFTFAQNGKLNQAVILQDPENAVKAEVQVQNQDGEWTTVGTLSAGYTNINIGQDTNALRLVWQGGSQPPVINEVIPKWEMKKTNEIVPKDAKASSSETDWLTPTNAIDGDPATRWSSGYNDNEWIYVDLGDSYKINAVKLDWEAAYGKGYKIQVSSDAENWTTVYSTTTGDGHLDSIQFDPVEARYVRMQGTDRGTKYGYSLWAFEVFKANE